MKEFTYPIFGICPNRIRVRINEEDMTFDSVLFAGGCPGNHEGINALCHGMKIEDVIKKLKGISCGGRRTSCPDKLAECLEASLKQLEE